MNPKERAVDDTRAAAVRPALDAIKERRASPRICADRHCIRTATVFVRRRNGKEIDLCVIHAARNADRSTEGAAQASRADERPPSEPMPIGVSAMVSDAGRGAERDNCSRSLRKVPSEAPSVAGTKSHRVV